MPALTQLERRFLNYQGLPADQIARVERMTVDQVLATWRRLKELGVVHATAYQPHAGPVHEQLSLDQLDRMMRGNRAPLQPANPGSAGPSTPKGAGDAHALHAGPRDESPRERAAAAATCTARADPHPVDSRRGREGRACRLAAAAGEGHGLEELTAARLGPSDGHLGCARGLPGMTPCHTPDPDGAAARACAQRQAARCSGPARPMTGRRARLGRRTAIALHRRAFVVRC
jgi:hypothetical protein